MCLVLHFADHGGDIVRALVGNGFQVSEQDGQGRAQFVGNIGDEITSNLLQVVDFGDITKYE